jgi:riboflavin kinase/FMN adenylyltransferase
VQLIGQAGELRAEGRKVSVAIGMFDGVHLGHQQVIRQAIFDARQHQGVSLAITFDAHPATVVAPARAPLLIYSLRQKLREIEALGVDAVLLLHFDRALSEKSGEGFVRELAASLGRIHSVCVGSNFVFGHKRSGHVALLQALGAELKFQVHGLAAVSLNKQVISSTRIRQSIGAGDLDAATQMLGRTYSIGGEVLRGDQLGRKLGFPTANVDVRGLALPPLGVYAVRARTAAGWHPGAANIGWRPTVAARPELRCEVHLIDFEGDLYGQELELCFVEFIRSERKFESLEALRQQIQSDVASARALL